MARVVPYALTSWLLAALGSVDAVSRRAVLDAVRSLTKDGWPASVREIADEAGHASTAPVHRHLRMLERGGYVERHPRRPKGGWMPGLRRDGP